MCWMVGRLFYELYSLILQRTLGRNCCQYPRLGASGVQLCAEPGAWQGHAVMSRTLAGAHLQVKNRANRHSDEGHWQKG